MAAFEFACVVVIALTLFAMMRARRAIAEVLGEYAILAVAGWVGEQSCIEFYEHYAYSESWHLFIGHVPLLIPLIWPLVILSAREVARALGAPARWQAVFAGAIVVFDAALVEVIAVGANLWSWAEPGHLGVPLIGILGWGFFATAAVALLDRPSWRVRLLAIAAAPLATHAALLATWWGLFRWVLRGTLQPASVVALCALSTLMVAGALALRRRGRSLELAVAVPRVIAAALFFALLAQPDVSTASLWICAAASALPYLTLTSYKLRFAGSPSSSHTQLPSR